MHVYACESYGAPGLNAYFLDFLSENKLYAKLMHINNSLFF